MFTGDNNRRNIYFLPVFFLLKLISLFDSFSLPLSRYCKKGLQAQPASWWLFKFFELSHVVLVTESPFSLPEEK